MASRQLLERESELAALDAVIAGAIGGAGRTVLIEAQAGLGKTALLDAAADRIRSRSELAVARFACGELERQLPWSGAAGLLAGPVRGLERRARRRLLDGAAAPAAFLFDPRRPAPADHEGHEVIRGLFEIVLTAIEWQPTVLLVDDAQWCDSASLRFLVYLQRRVADLAGGLVVAMRPPSGESAALLGRLAAPGVEVLSLRALGVESVGSLVRVDGFADAPDAFCRSCWEASGGNPFYLHELVLDLRAGHTDRRTVAVDVGSAALPSVARSVLVRLGQLDEAGTLELVRAVSVLGDGATLRHVGQLAGLAPGPLEAAADALAGAELLAPGEPVRFVHPLVRAAVYADIPAAQRAAQHARAAELLASAGAPPEEIAVQLLHGPRHGSADTVAVLRSAASRAAQRGAPQAGADYLRRALEEPPAEELRTEILLELARLEAATGNVAAAGRLEEALALAGEPGRRGRILLELGWVEHHAGRFSAAAETFERALTEAAAGPGELTDALEAGYVLSAMYDATRAADAQARVRAIEARSPADQGPAQRALLAQVLLARVMEGGSQAAVLELARRLWGEGRLLEQEGADSQTLWHVVGALSWSDAFDEALDASERGLADAERRGSALAQARAWYARAWPRYWTGDVSGAESDALAAIDIWRGGLETYLPAAVYWLVLALLERGEAAHAARALALAGPLERWQGTAFLGFLLAAEGHLAAARGEPEQALERHLECGQVADQLHFLNPSIMPWRSQAALAARLAGRMDQARRLAGEELELARRFGAPRALGSALRVVGAVSTGSDALHHLEEAEATLGRSGARLEHARALVDLGAAVRRAGRRADARPHLSRGLKLAQAAGAVEITRRAETELRAAGGRARRSSSTGVTSLTASERRVADLAAAGHTNRHIAQLLHVSVKAVEWHLHQTYLKLGIANRRALPEHLAAD